LLLYAIPQALTVGIAIGVPIGILWGLGGRQVSSRSRRAVAGLAFVSALGVWFTQNTLMPGANQAFRQLIARQLVGHRIVLARGANELSLSELSARIDAANRAGRTADLPALRRSFHMRWAASIAPLVLGLFAIAACSGVRTARKSLAIGFAVQIGYIWFYVAINPAADWSATSRVPPFAVAWSPNVIVTLLAILLLLRSRGSATNGHPCQPSSKSG
jgi:lipopolysaccharide export LptBFGC system permease protein LptF